MDVNDKESEDGIMNDIMYELIIYRTDSYPPTVEYVTEDELMDMELSTLNNDPTVASYEVVEI